MQSNITDDKRTGALHCKSCKSDEVFDKQLYAVLVGSYKMYKESMILTAICTLLIKGNCVESCYFQWYEKAVEAELKIAQLYEYYMASVVPADFHKALPRSVYLYFMHGNSLDYHNAHFYIQT